jgi:RNA polymerase sigma-70 factor (ECF subfamily)
LLHRFAALRDEAAFAALVQRHGAMVLRVCRGVLSSSQDAEDACQATFLTLARKADTMPWRDSVRCWLYGVARRLALQARSVAARRGRHLAERSGATESFEVPDDRAGPLDLVARRELRGLVNEELGQLPDKYRLPVVLCYLEGKTNEEAADALGWPVGSMSRRLARARALLRERLSRRGIILVVALTSLACLWPMLKSTAPPGADSTTTPGLACYAPGSVGGEDLDVVLGRVADGKPIAAPGRQHLSRVLLETPQVVDRLAGQKIGHGAWRELTAQLRHSGLALAQALTHDDASARGVAARHMLATCQSCHSTFRQ